MKNENNRYEVDGAGQTAILLSRLPAIISFDIMHRLGVLNMIS